MPSRSSIVPESGLWTAVAECPLWADTVAKVAAHLPDGKTERIHRQLGSAGQVLSDRIADLLTRKGLRDARVTDEIDALETDPRVAKAREEMDDREERRIQREARELDRMRKLLEDRRIRAARSPGGRDRKCVVGTPQQCHRQDWATGGRDT